MLLSTCLCASPILTLKNISKYLSIHTERLGLACNGIERDRDVFEGSRTISFNTGTLRLDSWDV